MGLSRAEIDAVRTEERRQLVASLRAIGPTGATLCDPWSSATLASHIVAAEQMGGIAWAVAWPLRGLVGPERTRVAIARLQPVQLWLMARAERKGWDRLLARLSSGPPLLLRTRTLSKVRLLEEWIHHEDLRRANGLPPRPSEKATEKALIEGLELLAAMPEFAEARREITAQPPTGRQLNASDASRVMVIGPSGEVLLALAGRRPIAEVAIEGDETFLDSPALQF